MTSTSGRNSSKATSRKRGRPRRSIEDIANASKPGDTVGKTKRKVYQDRTSWQVLEVKEFIRLLVAHRSSRKYATSVTYAKIAEEINDKFPGQRVPKTSHSCRTKHVNLRSEFELVSLIKAPSSGLDYDDTHGIVVLEHTREAWRKFCDAHPSAVKFEGIPWQYWNDFLQLMTATSDESHALHAAEPLNPPSAPGPEMPTISAGRDLSLIPFSMTPDSATPTILAPAGMDPNSIAPSSPSTYLVRSNAASAAMTSVSQTSRKRDDAKNMLERIWSVVMPKENQPIHVGAKVDPTSQVQVVPPTVPTPMASTSNPAPAYEYIERAADALDEIELGPTELNDVADYMSDVGNRHRVIFFLRFGKEARRVWIDNTLEEIRERKKRFGSG